MTHDALPPEPAASEPEASGAAAASTPTGGRRPRRTVQGTVLSDKMQKTISVRVDRVVQDGRYGKFLHRYSVLKAHDEAEQAEQGDVVEVALSRRLSKTKNWRLVRVVRKGKAEAVRGDEDREAVEARPVKRPVPPAPKEVPS